MSEQTNGRTQTRFEVIHPEESLIDTADTRERAQTIAENWAASNPGYPHALEEVRVFDAMARRGSVEGWAMIDGHWTPCLVRE